MRSILPIMRSTVFLSQCFSIRRIIGISNIGRTTGCSIVRAAGWTAGRMAGRTTAHSSILRTWILGYERRPKFPIKCVVETVNVRTVWPSIGQRKCPIICAVEALYIRTAWPSGLERWPQSERAGVRTPQPAPKSSHRDPKSKSTNTCWRRVPEPIRKKCPWQGKAITCN